jgi:hypothetical protein
LLLGRELGLNRRVGEEGVNNLQDSMTEELLEGLESMIAQARAGTLEETSKLAMSAITW